VAFTAKSAKAKGTRSFILVAALLALSVFFVPANANLHQALDLVEQAQKENSNPSPNATSDPYISKLLNSALILIK